MKLFFPKPQQPRIPKVPDPIPIQEVSDEVGDVAKRRAQKRSGFRRTILTGSLEPDTGKKRVLG